MRINLLDGSTRLTMPEDYNTKISGTVMKRDCPIPLWTAFLNKVTARDEALQAYLRRVAGYCMTGHITEGAMFFLYGTGANGKSVFLNTLADIWGDYAVTAPMDMFLESPYAAHPTELARLRGARMVIAQEVERNRRWAQAKLQALTGGEKIAARYMRKDFFEFIPQFKLVFAGNHKPSLRSINEAIRRRLQLIPFTVTIPEAERDIQLREKLKAEWPGILYWAVQGCLQWRRTGLAPPPVVREASAAYFAEEDLIGLWIEECCAVDKVYSQSSGEMYRSWKKWAEDAGEQPGSNKALSRSLEQLGFRLKHGRDGNFFSGIALKPPEEAEGETTKPYWVS